MTCDHLMPEFLCRRCHPELNNETRKEYHDRTLQDQRDETTSVAPVGEAGGLRADVRVHH
jgi:hypothetical protein